MRTTTATHPRIAERRAEIARRAATVLAGKIIAVVSRKGGEGKSRIALELSALFCGVLVDLDWDLGGISRLIGHRFEDYANAPLLDALRRGRTPRLWQRPGRPPLVPGHPDFVNWRPRTAVGELAAALQAWAAEWGLPVIVDTHPGYGVAAAEAISAACLSLTPVSMGTPDLNALEGQLLEVSSGAPTLIVPNMLEGLPSESHAIRIDTLASRHGVRVARRGIDRVRVLKERQSPRAVTALDPLPVRWEPYTEQVMTVAEEAMTCVQSAA